MNDQENAAVVRGLDWLGRFAPGLPHLLRYDFTNFRFDLTAGVSVAAVALPVAVAYAQLAGFDPVVGLYSSILPLVAYAIFGTSRQLIVGPDAATCALVAASVAPLAAGNPEHYWSLSVTLAFITGLFCVGASFLRLGALADFLSRPILVGFLNGISISVFLGQIGKIFGFNIESGGIIPRLYEILTRLGETHWPTLAVGLTAFAAHIASQRLFPRLPAALVAMVVTGLLVALLGLDRHGVAILGPVPAGLPPLRLPAFPFETLPKLVADAAGLALVLFSSAMLTARSFASKNRYDIDVDREFAALGAANVAAALSQGFAVSGADSRTAMSDATGGRTRVTGLVTAAAISLVLLFFTEPLSYVPVAALGVVLVFAAVSLFDLRALREIFRMDRLEFSLSLLTTLGVVAVGAINAILVAVGLALVRFIRITARPMDEVLGKVDGMPGMHSIERHPGARTYEGLLIYRFDGPITFFNSPYFKRRVLQKARAAGPGLKWLVIDAIPISSTDLTGLYTLIDVNRELESMGVALVIAGRRTEFLAWMKNIGLYRPEMEDRIYPTLRQALKAYRRTVQGAEAPPVED